MRTTISKVYNIMLYCYTYIDVSFYLFSRKLKEQKRALVDHIHDVDWIRRNGPYKGEDE